jgi:hypothetical protein
MPSETRVNRRASEAVVVKDALRRMEQTLTSRKCHLAAEEARRWGRHLPSIAHSSEEPEVEQIVDTLATFRRLHGTREDLRRRIGQTVSPRSAPVRKAPQWSVSKCAPSKCPLIEHTGALLAAEQASLDGTSQPAASRPALT